MYQCLNLSFFLSMSPSTKASPPPSLEIRSRPPGAIFWWKMLLVHKILPEPETILESPGAIFSYEIKTLLLIKKTYRYATVKFCEMMGNSYVVSVKDIESSTELFIIYYLTGAFLWQTFAPGYLILHHFRAKIGGFTSANLRFCALYFKACPPIKINNILYSDLMTACIPTTHTPPYPSVWHENIPAHKVNLAATENI